MNTITHFLSCSTTLFAALALTLSACGFNDDDATKPILVGEGKGVATARLAEAFSVINLDADADVFIQPGAEAKIEVEAQQNLQPYILTYVRGNKLVIKTTGNLNPTEKIKVFVTVPALTKIQVTGAGRIIGSNTFTTDAFTAKIDGAGRIDVAVEAKEIQTQVTGSGSIYLEGKTVTYKGTVNGSGTIETPKLVTSQPV